MAELSVLAVASEAFPLIKTGGLADVVGALPAALAREGVATRTLIPGYPGVRAALREREFVHEFPALFGAPARLLAARVSELDLLVLDAPHLYDRPGNPYVGADGKDWPDNGVRYAALAQAAVAVARDGIAGAAPDIVHAHDWQAGLVPALLHYGDAPHPPTVMTIHNLAFQGLFRRELMPLIGLPPSAFAIDGVEFHGWVSYLKAGLAFADRLTTVSPTYAAEIRTAAQGMGLDGVLRARADRLVGIRNGIDENVWDPRTDEYLAARYDPRTLNRRAANKAALQARLGLDADAAAPLFGVVSRLTAQKGMDLLLEALPGLVRAGAQLSLLGSGDHALEDLFASAARRNPGRVAAHLGYDESLAHLTQGGADALLVPSRFEPCGLTQLCALRYGAIPVVAHVGGLADTIIDANEAALSAGAATGLQFVPVTREGVELAVERALALWRDGATWRRMQNRAMACDVGWEAPARRYAALYRALASEAAAR
jgi:starch synthase